MKNIFGNYQVWKMNDGGLSKGYVDSFDTQKEAQEYIEKNYILWKNPKWEIVSDSRPMIKTKIKGDNCYTQVCITVIPPQLKKVGDTIELSGKLKFGELIGDFSDGTGAMFIDLNGKTGEIVDCKLDMDRDFYIACIIYTIQFSLFGENVRFCKACSFNYFNGISNLKITPITTEEPLNV